MKSFLLAMSVSLALTLGASEAGAADGSKLITACKANQSLPQGVSADTYLKFCQCLVTKAGDNQSVIDEHTEIATAAAADVQAKIDASSETAKANAAACQTETGMAPPPPPAQ